MVKIYYRPRYTKIQSPVKKLIRFHKVSLEPGETKGVSVHIPYRDLGYYVCVHSMVSSGNHTFWPGSSSQDWMLKNGIVAISAAQMARPGSQYICGRRLISLGIHAFWAGPSSPDLQLKHGKVAMSTETHVEAR